ncbi:rod shape-determining protein RodA [Acidobacteriota bacterium]
MIDRQQIRNIDWILIGLLLLNSLIGVFFIYSSSHYLPGDYFLKQVFWILISIAALFLFLSIDYNTLVVYSFYAFILIIPVLFSVLFLGKLIAGTKSWIKLPFFQIQPSEFAKIVVILLLARVFSKSKNEYLGIGKGILSGVIVIIPVVLVALQPDLGTALTFFPILIASLFLAGLNRKTIIFLLVIGLLLGVFGWNFALKDYQKKRLSTLLSPGQDPLGSGYQIIQSKIAIGSGGLLGKGYKKGTQSQLKFLPARHTDFIFSVIGEEFGFLGVATTLLIYFLLLANLFQSTMKAKDRVGAYIVFMVAVLIASQFFINVMMVAGLFPIAGIPLPLISYGGSSLLANYLAVSLVINVKMRRFVNV